MEETWLIQERAFEGHVSTAAPPSLSATLI